MSIPENQHLPKTPDGSARIAMLNKFAVWGLFLTFLYLIRDFFFTAFMTFMISYLTLAAVGWCMARFSPGRERPRLRRWLTVAIFVSGLVILVGLGSLIAPRLVEQGQSLAGRLSHISPETEVARILEQYVGAYQFRQKYGNPKDPEYQKDLEEFGKGGVRHVKEFNEFPSLEAWVESGFGRQFTDSQRAKIRQQLLREGTSSKEFETWFVGTKYPQLQQQARQPVADKMVTSAPADPLVRLAASDTANQLLQQARRDTTLLAALREEWLRDSVEHGITEARRSLEYQLQFQKYFENHRKAFPGSMPYSFEQFSELQKARAKGPRAFGDAFDKMRPSVLAENETKLRADFEAAQSHELFQEWWASSSTATFVRHHIGTGISGGAARMEQVLYSILDVPRSLGTALLLSFFICIDFPKLKGGIRRLQDTWLKEAYDEIAPVLSGLGRLVGRSLRAQGLIALCNAICILIALTLLGVEHEVLLALAVFVLSLVPTLGAILAWALVVAFATIQPGGGLFLALKVSAAFVFVWLMETFVFSPRILGRMMKLHSVVFLSILPLAQYFFGVWGVILATPVAVYVIHVVILGQGLPGIDTPHNASGKESAESARR